MRKQVAGKDRRLVAAGAGAHLQEDVLVVARILRQQQQAQLCFGGLDALSSRDDFLVAERCACRRPHRASSSPRGREVALADRGSRGSARRAAAGGHIPWTSRGIAASPRPLRRWRAGGRPPRSDRTVSRGVGGWIPSWAWQRAVAARELSRGRRARRQVVKGAAFSGMSAVCDKLRDARRACRRLYSD